MIDPEMIEARVEPSSNLIAKDATFSPCLSLMPLIEPTDDTNRTKISEAY